MFGSGEVIGVMSSSASSRLLQRLLLLLLMLRVGGVTTWEPGGGGGGGGVNRSGPGPGLEPGGTPKGDTGVRIWGGGVFGSGGAIGDRLFALFFIFFFFP